MTTSPDQPAVLSRARAAFVTDRLLVGGDLDGIDRELARAQLDELVSRGVTHILDTRLEWSDEEYVARHAPGLGYLHLGVDDDGGTLPDSWFDEAVAWLDTALAEPDARALVHCHMGVNRSPSLVFAYLLHQGRGVRDALDAIRNAWRIAVIDYADDALAWHHRRTHAPAAVREADIRVLAQWRQENAIDPVQVIRSIREDEALRLVARNLRLVAQVLRHDGGESIGCWLFQLTGHYAARCLADYEAGVDSWILPISRHTDDVLPDDLILLWQLDAGDSGLIGYAVVNETGLPASGPAAWADPQGTEQPSAAVEAQLMYVAPHVLVTGPELEEWPEFAHERFDLFGGTHRSNLFTVGAEHLERIATLLQTKAAH